MYLDFLLDETTFAYMHNLRWNLRSANSMCLCRLFIGKEAVFLALQANMNEGQEIWTFYERVKPDVRHKTE